MCDKKTEYVIRILGAISTAIMFSLFVWFALVISQLPSTGFFNPEYCKEAHEMGKINSKLFLIPWLVISLLSFFIISIASFRIDLGKPTSGKIEISDVFDKPDRLFEDIRKEKYSLNTVILLLVIISVLHGVLMTLDTYIFIQAKYGSMLRKFMNTTDYSNILSYLEQIPLALISSVIGFFMQVFALSFFIYWFSRIVGAKIPYLTIYTLLVYLSLIPLSFLGVSVLANAVSYLLWDNVSTLNTLFFPLIGHLVLFITCMDGISKMGDISLKRSFLVVLPFLVIITFVIYLSYFFAYQLVSNTIECVYWLTGI